MKKVMIALLIVFLFIISYSAINWITAPCKYCELRDVPGVSEYTLSLKNTLYFSPSLVQRESINKYVFTIKPVNESQFRFPVYRISCSGSDFNTFITEFKYITNRSSFFSISSNYLGKQFKETVLSSIEVIRHPIDFFKSIKEVPGFLVEKAKEYVNDPNIISKLRAFYLDQVKEIARENGLDFNFIHLDETKDYLEREVKARWVGKSVGEIAPFLAPYGIVMVGKSVSGISKGVKVLKFAQRSEKVAKEEVKVAKVAKYSETSSIFTKIEKLWIKNSTKVNFKDIEVFKRNELFDPKFKDALGRTNIERMKNGFSPLGKDGKEIDLHHVAQKKGGPIIEVSKTEHRMYNREIHPIREESQIDRAKFNNWKKDYWPERAKDFLNG